MNIYNILVKPKAQSSTQDVRTLFIEEKFSMSGFVFQGLWLLRHKLWIPAAIFIVINIILSSLLNVSVINQAGFYLFQLVMALCIAQFANTWYIESLKKKGYEFMGVIAARNLESAKLRFYQEYYVEGGNVR
jgi:hypothetical protein